MNAQKNSPTQKFNKDKFLGKVFTWSRYRFRLRKKLEDVPRDFNDWRKICFKHQVEQSLCHCKESEHHFLATPKIAIPKKDNKKAWDKLKTYLLDGNDNDPDATVYTSFIPVSKLYPNERVLFRMAGIKPKRAFYKYEL